MTDTFSDNWSPQVGGQGSGTLRAREAAFGDGYVQDSADGINTHLQTWPLSWIGRVGDPIDPVAIRDWLAARVGQRFLWTPPGGVQGQYVCKSTYNLTPLGADVFQLAATFLERATP